MASPMDPVSVPPKESRLTVLFREAIISMLAGVGVMVLVFLGRPHILGFRLMAYGALTGLSIFACCRSLWALLGGWFRKRGAVAPRFAAAPVFFIGGCLGWILAYLMASALSLVKFERRGSDLGMAFSIAGSSALVVGLLFYSFSAIQNRLRESVARLKEAEFAEKELELARSIQRRLLPPQEIEGHGFRIAARNLPAHFVAGDFYDVFHLADGTLGLVVADVSGKGIGASLIMASVKAVVPLVAAGRSAAETLRELNRKLLLELAPREFVALACARYDPATRNLDLANAGLPDPYRLDAAGKVEPLSVPGPRLPLGVRPEVAYESVTVRLLAAERVLFVTDGLPEAPKADGEPLGYEVLPRLVPVGTMSPGELLDRFFENVRRSTSQTLEDDWTALLLEVEGAA